MTRRFQIFVARCHFKRPEFFLSEHRPGRRRGWGESWKRRRGWPRTESARCRGCRRSGRACIPERNKFKILWWFFCVLNWFWFYYILIEMNAHSETTIVIRFWFYVVELENFFSSLKLKSLYWMKYILTLLLGISI